MVVTGTKINDWTSVCLGTKRRDRDIQGSTALWATTKAIYFGAPVCQFCLRDTAVYDRSRLVSACARYRCGPPPLCFIFIFSLEMRRGLLRRVGFSCYAITIVYAYTTSCHRWLYHSTFPLASFSSSAACRRGPYAALHAFPF